MNAIELIRELHRLAEDPRLLELTVRDPDLEIYYDDDGVLRSFEKFELEFQFRASNTEPLRVNLVVL